LFRKRVCRGFATPIFPARARSPVLESFLALTRRLAGVETMEREIEERPE
jgi:hypothetical protein